MTESFAVINVDDEFLSKDIKISNDLIEVKLKMELDKIYEEMTKLEPQQKIFFLDRLLMEFLVRGNLPEFYQNAVLNRVKQGIDNLNKLDLKDNKNYGSYIG